MRAFLLDASPVGDELTAAAADAVAAELRTRGYEVERVLARDLSVAPCTGCFGCWVRHPGECVIDDDARAVAAGIIASDAYAVVTPVRFGTYGSLAKGVLDRCICLILPYFKDVDGEIHHEKRYERYPDYFVVGTMPERDEPSAAAFAHLVSRNAINLHNPSSACAVIAALDDAAGAVRTALDAARIGMEVPA